MAAASTSDVREWAREQGYELGGKGRIKQAIRDEYAAAHPDGPGEPAPDGPAGDDYDGGVTEADFPPGTEAAEPAADRAVEAAAERRPRRVATAKAPGRSFSQRIWGGGGARPKRPAKKHPRISLKGMAEDVFLDMAWTFQGLPPLEKILYLQAPLAGQVVEDSVRGTAADKVLQPIARADRQFKALEALTAPAWVAAIMLRGRKDDTGEYSPETKLMFSGLRHSLLSMSRVVDDFDFERQKAKSEELRTASGQIDAMIAYLFEMPELTEEQLQQMAAAQAARAGANGQ